MQANYKVQYNTKEWKIKKMRSEEYIEAIICEIKQLRPQPHSYTDQS